MANYYLDLIGLNTFIYEPVGFDGTTSEKITSTHDIQNPLNYIGLHDSETAHEELSIGRYKNFSFSHNLPDPTKGTAATSSAEKLRATASFFPVLMLHRNGPYGWPAYKSMRLSHNPLTRKQRRENLLSITGKPTVRTNVENGRVVTRLPRKGARLVFDEPSVVARHKPIVYSFGFNENIETSYGHETTRMRRLRIRHSFDNLLYTMTNEEINKAFDKPNSYLELLESDTEEFPTSIEEYQGITSLYLDGAIDDPDSPIDEFLFIRYGSVIFPPEKYTFKSYTRQRTTFTFNWRDTLANRQENAGDGIARTANFARSMWPLDVDPDWQNFSTPFINNLGVSNTSSFGILWNHYAQLSEGTTGFVFNPSLNSRFLPAPIYARRHGVPDKNSVVSPTGLIGIKHSADFADGTEIFAGEAAWDCPSQAPSSSGPFYDSYDEYCKDIRLIGKNYSIVPEFRISDFVEEYQSRAVDDPINEFLSINGGKANVTNSSTQEFYNIFTTTELMKSLDFVIDDHEDFAEPTHLSITCKAISKFLPYDGFYPVQRSVDLAKQFYNSYKDNVQFPSSSTPFGFTSDIKIAFQNLYTPLAAPGVLYNSIKSGIACDYPLTTGSNTIGSPSTFTGKPNHRFAINGFDTRIPFEAIVEPQKHLANVIIRSQEYSTSASTNVTCSWDGGGDQLYAKMANNFLGEIPNFFLDGASNSAIASKKNKDIFFVEEDTTYAMRVQIYRTLSEPRPLVTNSSGVEYRVPQDIANGVNKETITMYSRPSAFGTPTSGTVSSAGGHAISKTFETTGILTSSNKVVMGSSEGLNYPYTPPYYHGRAWADIVYKSGTRTGRVQLDEIIASSSVTYHRFDNTIYSDNGYASASTWTADRGPQAITRLNDNAMQVSASLNLFGFAQVGEFNEPVVENRENARWVIQTKFETPILNFKDYEDHTTITTPTANSGIAKHQIPRGMWHQFGKIPTSRQGIYMQVGDVPASWNKAHGRDPKTALTASLAKLCGFSTLPVKLGKIAESITVKEAVVMVPYKELDNEKQFFKIHENSENAKEIIRVAKHIEQFNEVPKYAQHVLGPDEIEKARSLVPMVRKMHNFVMPPQMDFVTYPDAIVPYVGYIFDFEYTFTTEDLQYIWQGLLPPSAQKHHKLKRRVRHSLGDNRKLTPKDIIDNPNIRWIVFKVKQRANTNYFDNIYLQAGKSNFARQQPQGTLAAVPESVKIENQPNRGISYNWPYDFFSFIELIKIDANVTLRGTDPDTKKEIKIVRNRNAVSRATEGASRASRPFSED